MHLAIQDAMFVEISASRHGSMHKSILSSHRLGWRARTSGDLKTVTKFILACVTQKLAHHLDEFSEEFMHFLYIFRSRLIPISEKPF